MENTFLKFPKYFKVSISDVKIMVWFDLVLWYNNHCRSVNAKSILYLFIKYMISEHILLITFLKETELIFYQTIKWFHLFLSNTNNSTYYLSFVRTQFNVFKYCYVSRTIQLNIRHLFTHS